MLPSSFYYSYATDLNINSFSKANSHFSGFSSASKKLGVDFSLIDGRRFFIKNGVVIGTYYKMHTSLVEPSVIALCRDKLKTLKKLDLRGVSVPKVHCFNYYLSFRKAFRYSRKYAGDLVMKPCNARAGQGITTSLASDHESFKNAWKKAKAASTNRKILLEEKLVGVDVRALVVDGSFVCAVTRLPAYVVGDGISSVSELIDKKNVLRKQNKAHARHPLKLEYYSVDPALVPDQGQFFQLTEISNVHLGGEAVDVTDLLPAGLIHLAESAAAAIPGLGVVGVDLIATDFEAGVGKVIELNTACNFMIHQAPLYGKPRYPAERVLETMLARAGFSV